MSEIDFISNIYLENGSEMEDALNVPYQPCKLLKKILPVTFIDLLFNRKHKIKNSEKSSEIKDIDKSTDLFLLPYDAEDRSIIKRSAEKLNINKLSRDSKPDNNISEQSKRYVCCGLFDNISSKFQTYFHHI